MDTNTFHLGLCMAGSVSAGAYTAGVVDYLMEALEAWEKDRQTDPSLPTHKVEIDLLGGSSGGGITAAMAFFAFRDQVQHASLQEDGRTYTVDPDRNIFWRSWVELTGGDVFGEMLENDDIDDYYIPSAMNSGFIDKVANIFKAYIHNMAQKAPNDLAQANFLSDASELFMTLFNVTGIKYELNSKALSAKQQYISEHRDLAHFRWSDTYQKDGRLEISLQNLQHLDKVLQASKATGAFPIGLKAREFERPAKYIWDNPFFQKNNKFNRETINLGKGITDDEHLYTSLNADGGTSNNEPVEMMRDLMLQIRLREENNKAKLKTVMAMDDTERMVEKSKLKNYSILLVDPFPAYDFDVTAPTPKMDHIFTYAPKLVFAMASQLLFDAKQAFDSYNKNNYGLHVIAPSRKSAPKPQYSIACGALGGFGGFLNKEYRIHDYFLGRHNCQSFLRKYFVVNPDEPKEENGKPNDNYDCIAAVLEGYKNEAAFNRYCFKDEKGQRWLPIIPDATLRAPIRVIEKQLNDHLRELEWIEPGELPLYEMKLPAKDFLEKYRKGIEKRINKLLRNTYDSSWFVDWIQRVVADKMDDNLADKVIEKIYKDLKERSLIR